MDILLVYSNDHLSGWSRTPDGKNQPLIIEGSLDPLPCEDMHTLRNALMDVLDNKEAHTWHIFTSSSNAGALFELLQTIPALPCWNMHIQSCLENTDLLPEQRLAQMLHFLKESTSDESISHPSAALDSSTLLRLQEEQRVLEQRIQAMRRLDMERLLTYLPALFERFFAMVNPADLALLSGNLDLPNIPSPYPEPSPEALNELQADFFRLPKEIQQEILNLARRLPQYPKLKMRHGIRNRLDKQE